MPGVDVTRYLRRIGYDGPLDADHRTLAALQRAHLLAVPFDALDCHLGNPVTVEPADAYRKVVEHGRGGYCFELNGLFAWLLGELGFDVTLLAAQPAIGDDRYAPPDAHLTLRVDLEHPLARRRRLRPLRDRAAADRQRGRSRSAATAASASCPTATGCAPRSSTPATTRTPTASRSRRARARSSPSAAATTAPTRSRPFVRSATVQQIFDDGWVGVRRDKLSGRRGDRALDRPLADEADWRAELERQFGLVVRGTRVRGRACAAAPERT